MYRTDKQFMKNPATATSRIYIGGLPKPIIADDLEAKFSKHGKILGLVINSGFAFIQYEFEEEAQNAIRAENGTNMMGRKITVRQAFAGKDNSGTPNKGIPQKPVGILQRSAVLTNEPPNGERLQENRNIPFETPQAVEQDNETQEQESESSLNIRPPQQNFQKDESQLQSQQQMRRGVRINRSATKNVSRGGFQQRESRNLPAKHGDLFPENAGSGGYYEDFGPPQVMDIAPPPERNDCEIIVVSRALTEYAEFIESRLKHLGLIVDLLFPNEDVPIGKVLANISSRGCLYAILVMPQNEEHRSLTLNILHGLPQEHRNMPFDDALLLLQRNFEAYMRGEKAPEDPVKMSLADRHPVPIQMLFNLLAENRMLSTSQYDRIIKYLQERKQLQHEHEISEGVTLDSNDASNDKQNELQNRIMNILNKTSETTIPKSITAPDKVRQEPPTRLLKDPSVQKALDSILSGDLLKGIAGGL
ncbi:hypothetical protein ABEB36_001193 [Hypothenemus hampei]|uniref:RRM domain-containing protein n=1 Tax=Hypothenemus hampei TaxID=57062 RepID=A0ABD1FHC3_HYPHA